MIETLNQLRGHALAWLGRQEYYQRKFRQKLSDKQATPEQIELLVAEFIERGWLSEARYCAGFVRSRVNKGQGIRRIQADGRQKGLDEAELNQAISGAEVDWFEQAQSTYAKRFADQPCVDLKEKAKRLRFMQYRGFDMAQISYAMAQDSDESIDED